MDFAKMAAARKIELHNRMNEAKKRWAPMLQLVENRYKAEGKKLPDYQASNMAMLCDNLFDHYMARGGGLNEETASSNVAFVRQLAA